MTGDRYIQSVIDHVPHGMAPRDHIALELRGHIAERTAQGQPLDEVLRQLGDPLTLAESYLAAIPLMNAGLMARLAAKVVDAAIFLAPAAALVVLVRAGRLPPGSGLFLLSIFGSVVAFLAYIVIAEHRLGWTLGKRLMGLRVVRESGARISLGQSLLRQVPFIGQFFFIDALFALFTERRQRAFELLTKTRTIALLICIGVLAPDAGVVHAPGKQGLPPDDYLRMRSTAEPLAPFQKRLLYNNTNDVALAAADAAAGQSWRARNVS